MPTKISDEHVDHYRRHGYAVIEGYLGPDEVLAAQAEVDALCPGWIPYAADPVANPAPEDKGVVVRVFPFAGPTLNAATTSAEIRDFVHRIVGHEDLFLEQSNLLLKQSGGLLDDDQYFHCDFSNHTLTYPPDDPAFWQVAFILYHTDVSEHHAPTAVISNDLVEGELLWPTSRMRGDRPELYEQERKLTVPAGTLFAYSMRTFHRGTKFTNPGARAVQFITYAPANCPWMGIISWSSRATTDEWHRYIEKATPAERELMGFPPPGHHFWTDETLTGVAARYPAMDMSPYRSS